MSNTQAAHWPPSELLFCMQPAYQDADSTALALQAAAPIGVTHFSTEHLQRIAGRS